MSGLRVEHISKKYASQQAATLEDISLEVGADEFLVLLGPSGCGKTTLLKIICGLVQPSGGRVLLDGVDLTELPPERRGIGMVFQDYALFPHMNVKRNISFPLEVAGVRRRARNGIVEGIAEKMEILRHLKKQPDRLSGGERQRVAIGRTMVRECQAYLLDEPFANLDQQLRQQLRDEILVMARESHLPFVFVTHDQVDAMTLATRVAVMNEGRIQQLGTPDEIYARPNSVFVAKFVGTPQINLLPRGSQLVGVRPESFEFEPCGKDALHLRGELTSYAYLGSQLLLELRVEGQDVRALAPVHLRAKLGEPLDLFVPAGKLHFFDAESGLRVEGAL